LGRSRFAFTPNAVRRLPNLGCGRFGGSGEFWGVGLVGDDVGGLGGLVEEPGVGGFHLRASRVPSKVPENPCPAPFAHGVQFRFGTRQGVGKGGFQGVDAVLDPPAGAFADEPLPGRTGAGDDRRPAHKSFGDGDRKVLRKAGQDVERGGFEEGVLILPKHLAGEGDTRDGVLRNEFLARRPAPAVGPG